MTNDLYCMRVIGTVHAKMGKGCCFEGSAKSAFQVLTKCIRLSAPHFTAVSPFCTTWLAAVELLQIVLVGKTS